MSSDGSRRLAWWLRFGFLADGCFKLLVAITYVVLNPFLADALGTAGRLITITALLVLASGIAEIAFAIRRGTGSHTRYLIAYDSGWLAATAIAAVLAIQAVGLAGEVWFIYQMIASPLIAVVFALGARRSTTR